MSVIGLVISPAAADGVRVRYPEGTVRGFLNMKALDADIATTGDLFQEVHGDRIEARLIFRFKDGSLHDEMVTFSQQGVFKMWTYHIIQRGPAFSENLEVSLDRTAGGTYKVISGKGNDVKHYDGHLDLPDDVYNGMVLTVVKNLAKGETRRVHIVAFTPKPRLVDLELAPVGDEKLVLGNAVRKVTHYKMKPRLGAVLGLLASVAGKMPKDYESWFLTDEVPAFVRFQGNLYIKGHIWRIELTSPEPAKGK